jgi:hypothetical protein
MAPKTKKFYAFAALAFLCPQAAAQQSAAAPESNLSPEAYIARHGGSLAPPGRLAIDGRRVECGQAPAVLDPEYYDFGGSYPGFLILNPKLFAGLPSAVKLWIYSHECVHQSVGKDEDKADCHAVQRGRREGWLSKEGLSQICEFMQPVHADKSHFNDGRKRCMLMQKCYQKDYAQ